MKKEKPAYFVNCDYLQERTGNYELRDKIVSKWEVVPEENGVGSICGNVAHETLLYNKHFLFLNYDQRKKIEDKTGYEKLREEYLYIWQTIPAALAMYRLICMFFADPTCQDNYKSVWCYPLRHKETGIYLEFGEHKASFQFWTAFYEAKQMPKEFTHDLLDLLDFLVSDNVPHPYDRVVAGSVA